MSSNSNLSTFVFDDEELVIYPGSRFSKQELKARLKEMGINYNNNQDREYLKNLYDSAITDYKNRVSIIRRIKRDTEILNSKLNQSQKESMINNSNINNYSNDLGKNKLMNLSYDIDKIYQNANNNYYQNFIQQNNNFEGFNKGYTYIRILLVYIPSQWSFGIKPQSFDLYMGKAIGMIAGGTTHPTLFGDCFGNLNWFGIILGGLWASIANVIDNHISRQKDNFFKIMVFFLAAYSFVVIGRGSVYNGFEEFAWGALFLFILKLISPYLSRVRFTVGGRELGRKIFHGDFLYNKWEQKH